MITPGTLFEEFGFNYIGPIDGHDLDALIPDAAEPAQAEGPAVPARHHAKGQGYKLAEADPILYHGVGSSMPPTASSRPRAAASHLHAGLRRLAVRHGQGATAPGRHHAGDARRLGHGALRQEFPERYFDVGIAEQHAVTFAAGLACEGMKPVVAIYSTFLQRAYDQLIHDVALQNLPVVFALDRGGLVGADGATHHGAFDLSYLRCMPNMVVMAPADENECRQMLYTAYTLDGPSAVRYPRGSGPGAAPVEPICGAAGRQGRNPPPAASGSRCWPSAPC
jgi:1-deoxy-D-xylulose-5-phosphate synthase